MSDPASSPVPRPLRGVVGPAFSHTLRELLTPLEIARLGLLWWTLPFNLRGRGEPVLLLPGLGGGESSMFVIRAYLRALGYAVFNWGLGRNDGKVQEKLPQVITALLERYEETGVPVALIGWSLGGYLAREAARDHPYAVSRVITMRSPLVGGPKYTATAGFFRRQGVSHDALEARVAARYHVPLQVPVTSLYSKTDGVVAWQASIDHWSPLAENVEVDTTHFGFGFSREALSLVAERLAGVAGPQRPATEHGEI